MVTNTERIQANNAELREAIQMAENLPDVGSGGEVVEPIIEPLTITENGTYTAHDGVDGYSPVVVDVPIPDGYIQPSGTKEITENGIYDVTECASAKVDVPDYLSMAMSNTLTEYSSDTVTYVRAYAFRDATALKSISLPNLKSSGSYSFQNTRLESVNMPLLENVANNMFYGSSLVSVYFPRAKTIYGGSFQSCTELKEAYFDVPTSINTNAFYGCTKLEKLILRRTAAICALANKNAFTASSIESGTGFVYVPKALLSQYQSATNWSAYASQIRAIEDYPEITGGIA